MELNNVKVVEKLQADGGTTKSGKAWKKQTIILETNDEQYSKKIAVIVWNDAVDSFEQIAEGAIVNAKIRVESREYNEKWYTDVTAYAVNVLSAPATPNPKSNTIKPNPNVAEEMTDLPW